MSSTATTTPSSNPSSTTTPARKPRENILDLSQYVSKSVLVKFIGGREVYGILRGYDTMINLVLEDCYEFIRDSQDHHKRKLGENNKQYVRKLGIVICRGTSLMHLCPVDGTEEIENPFEEDEE
ncbi:hypothetical protein FDP41_004151 [Naegleria fowleri]|uniref:Sm domain-containing protein n=1 Tax=Naegleria fowleri TaxID=5763 RepID=A0A6A5BPC5_NAEFO|nr:uncharacterized protein FDP41_004151 [Naegleria fowleri]KAF0976856.1 hypothetical protein FDP41_004151 [Naegleria fowleri]CAG4709397.1 unnamed protein product [Naegleria fowleri]